MATFRVERQSGRDTTVFLGTQQEAMAWVLRQQAEAELHGLVYTFRVVRSVDVHAGRGASVHNYEGFADRTAKPLSGKLSVQRDKKWSYRPEVGTPKRKGGLTRQRDRLDALCGAVQPRARLCKRWAKA